MVVVRAGPVSAAILSSAGMTPIITSNQAGLVTGLPLNITMSRGHEGCHAARVTAAGGNRQHTTTSEFGSFGYHSDHFHLSVNIVTFSPVFVIPSCSCRYVGRAAPSPRHPARLFWGRQRLRDTDTLPTAGNSVTRIMPRGEHGAYSPCQEVGGWGQVSSSERRDHVTS